MKATWSVVILFEDVPTREKAVKFCDQLVEQHWRENEFGMTWLPFSALSDSNAAMDALEKSCGADIVIFAARPEGPIPPVVTEWVESWLANRGEREGTLAGVMETGPTQTGWVAEKHSWLRGIAHRAGMDYLTEVPQDLARPIPDSLESFSERAQQMTSVLNEILHKRRLPRTLP